MVTPSLFPSVRRRPVGSRRAGIAAAAKARWIDSRMAKKKKLPSLFLQERVSRKLIRYGTAITTRVRSCQRQTKSKTNSNSDGGVVHSKTKIRNWQGMEPRSWFRNYLNNNFMTYTAASGRIQSLDWTVDWTSGLDWWTAGLWLVDQSYSAVQCYFLNNHVSNNTFSYLCIADYSISCSFATDPLTRLNLINPQNKINYTL